MPTAGAAIDRARTAAFYAAAPEISCPCEDCRRFLRLTPRLPEAVQTFLNELGVDARKLTEVYRLPDEAGKVRYGAFTAVCGELAENGERTPVLSLGESCAAWFRKEISLPEPGFPEPAIQLELELIFCDKNIR